jgi:hypothetical protein
MSSLTQVFLSQASNVTFDSKVVLTCPASSNFVDAFGGQYGPNGSYPAFSPYCDVTPSVGSSDAESFHSMVLTSALQFSCDVCPTGFYSVLAGSSNGAPNQVDNYPCRECPLGGVCTQQGVFASRDYWGANNSEGEVSFALCPSGYCTALAADSNGSLQQAALVPTGVQNSCGGSRVGVLCGDCAAGTVETLGSPVCVPVTTCKRDKRLIWPVLVAALFLSAGIQLLFVSGVWAAGKKPVSATFKLTLYFLQV